MSIDKNLIYYGLATHISKNIDGLYISGSIHRNEPYPNDIDIITRRNLDEVMREFNNLYNILMVIDGDKYKLFNILLPECHIPIDLWHSDSGYSFWYAKLLRNMDRGHNIYWRNQAKKIGLTLSEKGLFDNAVNQYLDITDKARLIKLLNIKH